MTLATPPRVDPRVRRTRALLHDALRSLAEDRPLGDISVADIADRATVSRATFYLHYADRDALLTDVIDSIITAEEAAAARSRVVLPVREGVPAPDYLVDFMSQLAANASVFRQALGPTGSARVTTHLRDRLRSALEDLLRQHAVVPQLVPHDVHAAWLAGALLGVITHWLDRQPLRPPAEVAEDMWRLAIQPAARRGVRRR